jgi:hypothetical protein
MTQAEAVAALQAGAAQVQTAIQWFEANTPSPKLTRLHVRAYALAQDAEELTGVAAGSIANPADGTPKP